MFFQYLRDRRILVFLLFLLILIFTVVFVLFQIPLPAVLYAAALFSVAGIPVAVRDFLRCRRQHRRLCRICSSGIVFPEELPVPETLEERDFHALILRLCQDREAILAEQMQMQQETENFYTLWLHQIKTPIAAMSLLLQQNTDLDASQLRQELFKIEQYASLTLEYLRIGSIAADLCAQPCSLSDVVRQAIKKYAPVFIYKKIGIVTEGLDRTVISDEKWLVFVTEQLLSNALKYTSSGEIRIWSEWTDDAGTVLYIQDTGIGIRSEDLPRVFERGFTGSNGRIDKKATGLGLYLCNMVCQKLCHKLSITSKPGEGTCVCVHFGRQDVQVE
ncbi:MAG: HAMP domain-containing histidine kinase [Clostridiales bacterium]|jgi:signal transduction histidine kinase|nr:HAMP domain-containing histidine kinase [Clostridiales bacterium]